MSRLRRLTLLLAGGLLLAGCPERDGDDWVLSGEKMWISLADVADHLLVGQYGLLDWIPVDLCKCLVYQYLNGITTRPDKTTSFSQAGKNLSVITTRSILARCYRVKSMMPEFRQVRPCPEPVISIVPIREIGEMFRNLYNIMRMNRPGMFPSCSIPAILDCHVYKRLAGR